MRVLILLIVAALAAAGPARAQTVEKLMVKGLGKSTYEREGKLDLPDGVAGKVPVVLFMPGTDGIDQRLPYHRAGFLKAGIGTLEIDTKTGIFKGVDDRPEPEFFEPIAFGALKVLQAHPKVDPARIGIMGWSAGGIISISSGHQMVANKYLSFGQPRFAAHVGLYGGCSMPRGRPAGVTGAPILIAYGTADTHNPYSRCVTFKQTFSNMELLTYQDIHHGFDKEGVNNNYGGRIMQWNQPAAEDAREKIRAFFVKHLKAVPPS